MSAELLAKLFVRSAQPFRKLQRVAAPITQNVERPSDFEGVVYVGPDTDGKVQLARELREARYRVDWNKVRQQIKWLRRST